MKNKPDSILGNTEELTPEMPEQTAPAPADPVEETATPVEAEAAEETLAPPVTRRYNKRGKRRGKYAYAAPLGLLISLLSIVGVVAIVSTCIGWIKDATDTTYLHDEMYYYLEPMIFYAPEPFTDAAKNPQDVFLNAAAYRVMAAESIRIDREKDESIYPVDENGRIAVPAEEIETAYKALYGASAKVQHKSLEESGLEYDQSDHCYYMHIQTPATMEQAFVVSVDRSSDEYEVRVGFVPKADIKLDRYGREVAPTEEMATHFKTFTLKRTDDDQYYVYACKNE
ncbi:MAG: hypothetical protein E7527_01990 [Ruminococcaceae bacterium]|nr:hypothetical protein [Oscillospiraceae bacterium]